MIFSLQKLEADISRFTNDGNIIIVGDLNDKTAIESDYVSDMQDHHSPINDIEIYNFDEELEGKNTDK